MTFTLGCRKSACAYLTICTIFHLRGFNSFLQIFPIKSQKGPDLTLLSNRPRSTRSHHLYKFVSTRKPSFEVIRLFVTEKIFKGYYQILAW